MRRAALPLLVLITIALAFAPSKSRAARAVPPVPWKHGPGPREGFSRDRLTIPPPGARGLAARAPLGAQATINVLAIRVAFSDTPIESTTAYYDRLLLFQKQFWEQQTEGSRTLTPTLVDSVFTLPHPMAYYGDDDHFQERLVFMVRDLVQLADSTVDFAPYQSLVIFHAGQGQEADVRDDSRNQIWSAFVTQQDFQTVLPDTTGAGRIGIRTNDLAGSSPVYVKEAVEVPESESQDGYVFGATGVVCHEFGHQLGLPDLYDTNGDEGGFSQGVGSWDVMGTGVWNFSGFAPAGLSAWSKIFLGVIAAQRVVTPQPVSLSMLERQVGSLPRAVQIPMTETEYLLLENRRQDLNGNGRFDFDDADADSAFDFYIDSYAGAEFDFYTPGDGAGSGILVYHIDDSVIAAGLLDNVVNANAARKGIDIVEADGIEDMDGPPSSYSDGSPDDVFRAGWRDKLTPATTPSTAAYGNVPTGISVTGISAPDSVMTFDVSFLQDKPGWPKLLNGRVRSAPSLAADVDQAGPPFTQELLVPVQRLNNTGALYIFRPDGNDFLDGDATPTPFASTTSGIVTSPCVGDVDGTPGNEIVFSTANGTLYAFHANGTEVVDGDNNPLTLGVVTTGLATGVRAQPILAEVDGTPGLEIVVGSPATAAGFSLVRVIRLAGGVLEQHSMLVGGSSEAPAVSTGLEGGTNQVVIAAKRTVIGESSLPGLYLLNWEILTDPVLALDDPDNIPLTRIASGQFSAPVAADLEGNGRHEIVVADTTGLFHAYRIAIGAHIPGDAPIGYVTTTELPGWPAPFPGVSRGRTSEVSVADLERDGHPEVFQTGEDVRVAALYWTGAPRAGYPLRLAAPGAPADTSGSWAPIVADVDGDGLRDVIPILPDGRRLAFRGDGSPIGGFAELGSTGISAPPILADLDGDGPAEWVETFDASSQAQIDVKIPVLPIPAASIGWGQYRLGPTRNAVVDAVTGGPSAGTQGLSEVYVYPNPSRDGTSRVHYRLEAAATSVSIRIYDASGSLVADLSTGAGDRLGSSEHSVAWNNGSIASGIYVCRVEVQSGGRTEVRFANLAIVR
ncbi:MAG TPA: M6 family metalloprotease domain-containing protein [Candidatus Binatia bacterium]|nr:M6 family metalloprotease domain-containing protein [Candidatus Binatia bacterium]